MTYQPIWRDGQLISAGRVDRADSESRYEWIASQLDALQPGFTVLDVGAAEGYFSVRIAEDFAANITAIDDNPRLAELDAGPAGPIHVVPLRISPIGLRYRPREDVVLALSVLHHFVDWRAALRWIVACREFAILEIPDPGERWMRTAAARNELPAMFDTVLSLPGAEIIAEHERVGRDGSRHSRPMVYVPGTVRRAVGTVFSGSGTCSRKLPEHGAGLGDRLGYVPFPGSLNLRLDRALDLSVPEVDWKGRNRRGVSRDYQFWNAWLDPNAEDVHLMRPGRRGHGDDCYELTSPVKLRDALGLVDGDEVAVDVEARWRPAKTGRRRGRR